MKTYKTLQELYLTFITSSNSEGMLKVPKGSTLELRNGYLYYNGKCSIDNEIGLEYHRYIEEVQPNG